MFNPLALYAPPMEQTDAMKMGTIVDEHFTESIDFYETYGSVTTLRRWSYTAHEYYVLGYWYSYQEC